MTTPPNFHVSYEKLKKLSEELRGGGDKDDEYWKWRNEGESEASSEEDNFRSWLAAKRNNKNSENRKPRNTKVETETNPNKRKKERRNEKKPVPENHLWDPGDWDTNKGRHRPHHPVSKTSTTARGGGVLRIPANKSERAQVPCSRTPTPKLDHGGFIYSSEEDSDRELDDNYRMGDASPQRLSNSSMELNVVGIEKRVEKSVREAEGCTVMYCKETCLKYVGEGMRKKASLDVLYLSLQEHYSEILQLRQDLACTLGCAMMYELEVPQEKQLEVVMWKNVFYLLIQHYRTSIASSKLDNEKMVLSSQLENHISEAIQFYNMLIKQIQKRYNVNYKSYSSSLTQNRTQVLALLLIHKILLSIGDLYRYLSQVRDCDEWGQSRNFYLLAQTLAPRNPKPYHQLALLGKYAHRRLHAVYFFAISQMVRNPFTQSRELLISVLAELQKKADILSKRDRERSKSTKEGRKEVLKNKVIEWIFDNNNDNNPCLNIPESDIRKRFVVYLLSSLGGLLSGVNMELVEPQFTQFTLFFCYHVKQYKFSYDEVYHQLLVILLFTYYNTQYPTQILGMLHTFVLPCIDPGNIPEGSQGSDWLTSLHAPLSVILLLAQCQLSTTNLIQQFSSEFWQLLVVWLNKLQSAIAKFKKYTDFTDESVSLKEVILLRGVEIFSSLQNITKPFYLTNLPRNESEDLGRAVLVINSFEKLAESLPFLNMNEDRVFTLDVGQLTTTPNQSDTAINLATTPTNQSDTVIKTTEATQVQQNAEADNSLVDTDDTRTANNNTPDKEVDNTADKDGDDTDSSADIEIMGIRNIVISPDQEAKVEDGSELSKLKQRKEELLQQFREKEDKRKAVSEAVKTYQGSRIYMRVKPRYIIPDTNCFLDDLCLVKKIIRSPFKLLLSLVVHDELQGLCKHEEKKERALEAVKMLDEEIAATTISVLTTSGTILESKHSNVSETRSKAKTNDDLILESVDRLSRRTGKQTRNDKDELVVDRIVVFLTNDSNLRVKSHPLNLAAQTIQQFVEAAKL